MSSMESRPVIQAGKQRENRLAKAGRMWYHNDERGADERLPPLLVEITPSQLCEGYGTE